MAQTHHVKAAELHGAAAESHRKAAELHGKHDDKQDLSTPRRRTRSPLKPIRPRRRRIARASRLPSRFDDSCGSGNPLPWSASRCEERGWRQREAARAASTNQTGMFNGIFDPIVSA
jgi:hypothetical protein